MKLLVWLVAAALAAPAWAGPAASLELLPRLQRYAASDAGRALTAGNAGALKLFMVGPTSDLSTRLEAYAELAALPNAASDAGLNELLRAHVARLRAEQESGLPFYTSELAPFRALPAGADIEELRRAPQRRALASAQAAVEALRPSRSIVYGRSAMVASSHPKASQVGLAVLDEGGTAADAAIAMNAFITAVDPTMSGPGGDLMVIGYDAKSGERYALNASGRSPAALTLDEVKKKYPQAKLLPMGDPVSWTVPGAVAGWFDLHERHGKLPMARLLAPAIEAASQGEPVTRVVAGDWTWTGWFETLLKKPGFAETFLLDGRRAPKEGEVFKNPALAKTYRLLAKFGRKAFYEGPISRAIVGLSKAVGGWFTHEDFKNGARAQWVKPYSMDYRGATIWELPPNGQGLAVLQILKIMKTYDFKALGWHPGHVDFWHAFIEAKKLVYELMARYYADPDAAKVPIDWLLSEELALRLRGMIGERARPLPDLQLPEPVTTGDTTNMMAADKRGNMVSLIQSPYLPFGSGYVAGGFGIQNRGALFSLDPKSPNRLEPGKRPFHTIIPGLVEYVRDGRKRRLAWSIMGADLQAYGQALLLIYLLDFGMDIQRMIDAPRMVLSGTTHPRGTPPNGAGQFYAEPGIPAEVVEGLKAKGHQQTTTADPNKLNWYAGGAHAVEIDLETGVRAGASDPRKDGAALGR